MTQNNENHTNQNPLQFNKKSCQVKQPANHQCLSQCESKLESYDWIRETEILVRCEVWGESYNCICIIYIYISLGIQSPNVRGLMSKGCLIISEMQAVFRFRYHSQKVSQWSLGLVYAKTKILVAGFPQAIWKICARQNGNSLPQKGGENSKNIWVATT